MKTLTIRPVPFRSSNLAVPPSPFSPRSPPQPLQAHPVQHTHPSHSPYSPPSTSSSRTRSTTSPTPPHAIQASLIPTPEHHPLVWLWQCHECYRSYPLSATRRCLNDGHVFCSGASSVKRGRKSKKRVGQPCASEFDYSGWKTWAVWRRAEASARSGRRARLKALRSKGKGKASQNAHEGGVEVEAEANADVVRRVKVVRGAERRARKDCWNYCDYPSECRWGKAYGVPSPPPPVKPPSPTFTLPRQPLPTHTVRPTSSPRVDGEGLTLDVHGPPTTFEDIFRTAEALVELSHVRQHSRIGLTAHSEASERGLRREEDVGDFWGALKKTVGKRKARKGPGPSPLRLEPVEEVDEEEKTSEVSDEEEDIEMKDM